jgi:hypothetical protein
MAVSLRKNGDPGATGDQVEQTAMSELVGTVKGDLTEMPAISEKEIEDRKLAQDACRGLMIALLTRAREAGGKTPDTWTRAADFTVGEAGKDPKCYLHVERDTVNGEVSGTAGRILIYEKDSRENAVELYTGGKAIVHDASGQPTYGEYTGDSVLAVRDLLFKDAYSETAPVSVVPVAENTEYTTGYTLAA